MRREAKAYVAGLTTVLLWSTVASAFKLTLRYLDYAQLLLYGAITSLLILGLILVVRGRFVDVFRASPNEYARSLAFGILNPFLYYLVLFKAYELLPAQVAQPLNYTWALTLAVLSIPLLKQRLAATDIFAGVICYAGVVIISTDGRFSSLGGLSPVGIALALGSTVIWALYWIYNTRDRRDPVVVLFTNFAFGLPFILIYCALFSSLRVEHAAGLLGAAYVGVVEMGFAFVLWLVALRLTDSVARIGNLIFLSPFISLLFIRAFLNEEIRRSTVLGLVLIVAGLITQQSSARRRRVAK